MSHLSLPVDDLHRFHVKVPLPASIADTLPLTLQAAPRGVMPPSSVSRASSEGTHLFTRSHDPPKCGNLDVGTAPPPFYNVHFQTDRDETGHFLRISSSAGVATSPGTYPDEQTAFQSYMWPGASIDHQAVSSVPTNGTETNLRRSSTMAFPTMADNEVNSSKLALYNVK
jgi:hypothetical protein